MFETIVFFDKIFKLKHFLHIIFLLKIYDKAKNLYKKIDPQKICTLGECPVIPPVHWKGVALPRQRSLGHCYSVEVCSCIYT